MMMPTMLLEQESSRTIRSFEVSRAGSQVVSARVDIQRNYDLSSLQRTPKVEGGKSVNEYLSKFKGDPAIEASLSNGAKWVADNYYPGERSIRALRLQKGLSQEDLALRIGSKQSYVSRIENGEVDLQLSTVRKLAAALETDINTINDYYG